MRRNYRKKDPPKENIKRTLEFIRSATNADKSSKEEKQVQNSGVQHWEDSQDEQRPTQGRWWALYQESGKSPECSNPYKPQKVNKGE